MGTFLFPCASHRRSLVIIDLFILHLFSLHYTHSVVHLRLPCSSVGCAACNPWPGPPSAKDTKTRTVTVVESMYINPDVTLGLNMIDMLRQIQNRAATHPCNYGELAPSFASPRMKTAIPTTSTRKWRVRTEMGNVWKQSSLFFRYWIVQREAGEWKDEASQCYATAAPRIRCRSMQVDADSKYVGASRCNSWLIEEIHGTFLDFCRKSITAWNAEIVSRLRTRSMLK